MVDLTIKLSEDFFKEEVRNGFLVSKNRKELWAIELDLLDQFRQICKKYNLAYYLDGGTLLGAIRHSGFVPWDDDIDILMPRKDYDLFIQYALKELKYPYFVQTDWTDSTFYCLTKLRRSDTTCIQQADLKGHFNFNQGIFIDICPLDNVPDDHTECHDFMHRLHLIKLEAICIKTRYQCYDHNQENKERLLYLRDQYQEIRQLYNFKHTERFANLAFPQTSASLRVRRDYNNSVLVKFEDDIYPVPEVYYNVLNMIYGSDFMTPIPGKSLHGKLLINTSLSYKNNYNQFIDL